MTADANREFNHGCTQMHTDPVRGWEEYAGIEMCAGQSETPVRMIAYLFMAGRLESGTLRLSSEHDAHLYVPRAQLGQQDFAPHFLLFARRYAQGDD